MLISVSRGGANVIDGVTSWALAYLLFAGGMALLLTRNVAPAFISIILANGLLAVGILLIYRGLLRFSALALPRGWPVALLAAYMVGLLFFTYSLPLYSARVLIVVSFFTIVCGMSLALIWSLPAKKRTHGIRLVAVSVVVIILAAVVRGGNALTLAKSSYAPHILDNGAVLPYYLLANTLSIVFLSMALVVLIHERLREELHELAAHDPLTGVLTRRVIIDILDKTVARLQRTGEAFSLMMFDLDNFKKINDTYGHLAGDEVLSTVIRAMESALRTEDYIGRYGGEEFLVVMAGQDPASITAVAERIRHIAEETEVAHGVEVIRCTVSIGAATISRSTSDTGNTLLALVDSALYEAKAAGRNRVIVLQH